MVDKLSINAFDAGKIRSIDPGSISAPGADQGADFKELLLNSINEVNRLQQEAQTATDKLMTGQTSNVGEALAAVKKADIAFSLLMQIRNKLLDAYSEIHNMRL